MLPGTEGVFITLLTTQVTVHMGDEMHQHQQEDDVQHNDWTNQCCSLKLTANMNQDLCR